MRRYTLNIGSNEFVIDVQETDFDQFEVTVGDAAYLVSLLEDQAIGISADPSASPVAPSVPRAVATASAPRAAPAPAAPRVQPAGAGGGKGALRLRNLKFFNQLAKAFAIFRKVNGLWRGADHRHAGFLQRK